MKKNIIVISIIVIVVIAVGAFLFMGKSSNQENENIYQEQNQNNEGTSIASLSIGNWVSVVAEKVNGSYAATMIMACDSKENCSNQKKISPSGANAPTGDAPSGMPPSRTGTAPTGEAPTGKRSGSMEDRSMLSGTVTEINADSIVLSLDTGETATVSISDSTRINKR